MQSNEPNETIIVSSTEQTVADLENPNNILTIRQPQQMEECLNTIAKNTCMARRNSEQDVQPTKKSQWNTDDPGGHYASNKTFLQEIPSIYHSEINLVKGLPMNDQLVLVPSTMLRKLTQMESIHETDTRKEVVIFPNYFHQKCDMKNKERNMCESYISTSTPYAETSCPKFRQQDFISTVSSEHFSSITVKKDQSNEKALEHDEFHSTKNKKIKHSQNRSRSKRLKKEKINCKRSKAEKIQRKQHKKNDGILLEICKVCGDSASAHIHYGGRSCPSCRAFFRRSVQKFSR